MSSIVTPEKPETVTFYLHDRPTSKPRPREVVVRPKDLRGADSYEWNDSRSRIFAERTCPASGLAAPGYVGSEEAAEHPQVFRWHCANWFTKLRFHSQHTVTICEDCAMELLRRLGRQDLLVTEETYPGCQHSGVHPPRIEREPFDVVRGTVRRLEWTREHKKQRMDEKGRVEPPTEVVAAEDDGTVTAYFYVRHHVDGDPYISEPKAVKIHPRDVDWQWSTFCLYEEDDAPRCHECLAPAVYRCQACLNPLDMEVMLMNDTKGFEGIFIICSACGDKLSALLNAPSPIQVMKRVGQAFTEQFGHPPNQPEGFDASAFMGGPTT